MPTMRQQPQGPARLAKGNPLGVTDLWIGSSSLTLVKGYNANKSGVNAATVVDGAGQGGRFVRGDGTTAGAGFSIAENSNVILGSTDSTWFIVRRCRDTVLRSIFMHYGYENGANSRCLLGAPEGSNITWDYGNATTGSGRLQAPYTKDTLIETLVVVAGQIKGREIWRRGVKLASNVNAKAGRTQDSRPFSIGRPEGGPAMDDVETYMFGVANREWSDAEIMAWSRDPWSVIESPKLRLAFPAPAGVSAAANWTEAPEIFSVAAAVRVALSVAWGEVPENTAIAGLASVISSATWTEGREAFSAAASSQVLIDAAWAEPRETGPTQISVGSEVSAAVGWAESPEVAAISGTARVNAAITWAEARETTAVTATVGDSISAAVSWIEARESTTLAAVSRLLAVPSWVEAREGFSALGMVGGSPSEIDALLVPPRQTVVFEGSRRVVAFEGGKRVVSFEGSKRMVVFQ